MTDPQRIHFFAVLWRDACLAAGWPEHDREFRLQKISAWIGRAIDSLAQVDHLKDFDAIKAGCLAASQPANLEPQLPGALARKRLLWKIREMAPPNYTAAIAQGKFGMAQIDDLDEGQLNQLRNTLAARMNHLRREDRSGEVSPANIPF